MMAGQYLGVRPGMIHLDIARQDRVWVDLLGVPHTLHEMTPQYRANVIRHLLEWIETTPLMRRLTAMTPDWETHATEDRDALTDEDVGRWRISTESTTYVLDLDARTSTRLRRADDAAVDLRRDGDAIPLARLIACQRGAPAVLLLDVRGDGVQTVRTTTPVQRITRQAGS